MRRNSKKSVLLVGDVMDDIIVVPEGDLRIGSDRAAKIAITSGGSAASQAVWLAKNELEVKLVARIGEKGAPALMRQFESNNIEPIFAIDKERDTGRLVAIIGADAERSFYTDRGANLALSLADIPDGIVAGADMVILSGYSFFVKGPREVVSEIMGRAKRNQKQVAIDPASTGFIRDVGVENFVEWTKGAQIIFPNKEEAELLSGEKSSAGQLAKLGKTYDLVVLKLGAKGACAMGKNGEIICVSAPSVRVVDSTGAGDAFLAGFVSAQLAGASLENCLEAAVKNGSLAVTKLGSQP